MIIGLTGKKRSGKSTASSYLQEKLQGVRISFKDRLVWELNEYFGKELDAQVEHYNNTQWDGMKPWTRERLIEEKPPLTRALMQSLGKLRRAENPNYLVEFWESDVDMSPNQTIIVDDTRFPNEALAIRKRGGIIIRVVRTDLVSEDTDESETQMDEIEPDYTISVKTGELEKLHSFLDYLTQNHSSTQPVILESHGESNNIR